MKRTDAPLAGLVPRLLYFVRLRAAMKAGLEGFCEPVRIRAG